MPNVEKDEGAYVNYMLGSDRSKVHPDEPLETVAERVTDDVARKVNSVRPEGDAWATYYREKQQRRFPNPEGLDYYLMRRRYAEQRVYLETVFTQLPEKNPRLGILGLGAGMEAAIAAKSGVPNIVGIDNEQGCIDLTGENLRTLNIEDHITYVKDDARNLENIPDNSLDVLCSLGMLEHYSEEDVIKIIQNSMRVAKCAIFVMPTDLAGIEENRRKLGLSPITTHNPTGNIGDENYRSAKEWEELFNKALTGVPGGVLEEKFGYWIPETGSTYKHPDNPQEYFGKGLFAGFVIKHP